MIRRAPPIAVNHSELPLGRGAPADEILHHLPDLLQVGRMASLAAW